MSDEGNMCGIYRALLMFNSVSTTLYVVTDNWIV